jgi:OmcA/MtrC family decaheme c-type cytochrome
VHQTEFEQGGKKMLSITRSLLVLATASAAVAPIIVRTPATRVIPSADVNPQQLYKKTQAEYYLTKEQYAFIRPGLHVTVEDVQIPADRHPVVDLTITDDMGQPLDRAGIQTPGPVSLSYVLSWYDAEHRDYVSYTTRPQTSPITGDTAIQASTDSGGTTEDLAMGHIRYTFGTQLPADYPQGVTTTVGIYASRDLSETPLAATQYDNIEYDFVPDGSAVVDRWEEILNSTCNSCHNQLALHGGSRRDVKLCVLCHNPETWDPDTGNTVNMKVMIHKIHFGPNLPSVQAGTPYQIIGYRQ